MTAHFRKRVAKCAVIDRAYNIVLNWFEELKTRVPVQ